MPDLTERFAANLQELRTEAGLTQEEVAFRAGVHPTRVSLMECGQRLPRFPTLVRLVGALGVDHGRLFAGIVWEPHEFTRHGYSVESREAGDDAAEET